ncbi:glycoside hydrolase domain-containing protein [Streptomyces tendae]|uniref:glycoside hydrolase domain-containing protein n=1 Tax=Streptomyces tendae TaxID=1932 RepID=UPI00367A547A
MDELVLRAQQFVNFTYGDIIGTTLEEDGRTGWATMYALTRALQYELGITALSNSFGPLTLSTLRAAYPSLTAATVPSDNFAKIVQSALYCKGYDGGDIDGIWGPRVTASVTQLKQDMGVGNVEGAGLTPKVFKGLLNMDPYVLVTYGDRAGSSAVQTVQRWLNGRYISRADFFVIPCDGHHSRSVAKSMLYAIQYELGMADGAANGVFGPATQSGLRSHPLTSGDSGVWVSLLTAALVLNDRPVGFTSSYDAQVAQAVALFQSYVALPPTGAVDFSTWASLLVSYGDQSRPGTACDCITTVTPARAQALHSAGYRHVGRYLSNVAGSALDKMIKPGELATIAAAGLTCFPIYQTWGGSADYFSYSQGIQDAHDAIVWARRHGFQDGARIYFAVDFDALDGEVTASVLPHFRGVHHVITTYSRYRIGVYGARNVCRRVSDAGYADASFVSDMSSGFSGNLGYTLPANWAFDQIATLTVGSGEGIIEIDKNIASGRDDGERTFNPASYTEALDVAIVAADHEAMKAEIRGYLESIGVPETGGDGWTDDDWITLGGISNSEAVDAVISMDWLFTRLARNLRLRKALVQAPVLWELRQFNPLDPIADAAVKAGLRDDSSTGWGQIFAWVAVEARNYCVEQGLLNEPLLTLEDDRSTVWTGLHEDPEYNIETAAYVTVYNAFQIGLPRPGLDTSDADTERIIARYNGTNEAAEQYGRDVGGVYRVMESYYARHRAAAN